jgi:hypothetical protein
MGFQKPRGDATKVGHSLRERRRTSPRFLWSKAGASPMAMGSGGLGTARPTCDGLSRAARRRDKGRALSPRAPSDVPTLSLVKRQGLRRWRWAAAGWGQPALPAMGFQEPRGDATKVGHSLRERRRASPRFLWSKGRGFVDGDGQRRAGDSPPLPAMGFQEPRGDATKVGHHSQLNR